MPPTHQREVSECPYFAECEYIREWRRAYDAPYVILVHSHLGVGWEGAGIGRWAGGFAADGEDDRTRFEHSFNPANAPIVVCDEDPTASLIERKPIGRDVIGAVAERGLGEHILTGLSAPSGLLDYLREKGITPEQIGFVADALRTHEGKRGQIATPGASDLTLRKAVASAASLVRVSGILERLADELASGRPGAAYSLLGAREELIAQGRRPWPFRKRRLLVLDGTANPEILRQFVPSLVTAPEIRVRRNARVIQVSNMTFYRGSLVKHTTTPEGKRKPVPTERLLEVGEFIARAALSGKTLVVTNKPVRCALTGEDEDGSLPTSANYRGVDIAHFGNIRGSNDFTEHEIAIILGRDETTVAVAEQRAMAIWYDTKEPIRRITPDIKGRINYRQRTRRYQMSHGTTKPGNVSIHPDPGVQAVVEQSREAEMIQAIDRLRLIHNEKRKTVYILCSVPLDLLIDELVTWNQLTGDRRLADALAECDERRWDVLPLAAKEMTRLFPSLWATEKAAERWLAKNPLEAYRDLIMVWGVFADWKPQRRRRWSKALVRHGADPRTALGAVLGVTAEDVQVRESAGSEPPVTPNTATSPSNPNSNTEVARSSNGEPGSHFGDN